MYTMKKHLDVDRFSLMMLFQAEYGVVFQKEDLLADGLVRVIGENSCNSIVVELVRPQIGYLEIARVMYLKGDYSDSRLSFKVVV